MLRCACLFTSTSTASPFSNDQHKEITPSSAKCDYRHLDTRTSTACDVTIGNVDEKNYM